MHEALQVRSPNNGEHQKCPEVPDLLHQTIAFCKNQQIYQIFTKYKKNKKKEYVTIIVEDSLISFKFIQNKPYISQKKKKKKVFLFYVIFKKKCSYKIYQRLPHSFDHHLEIITSKLIITN